MPATLECGLILRDNSRRAYYTITESVLDLVLAHWTLFGFHGSSVSFGQDAVTFLGAAGAGKTSLTLASVRSGAKFISNDISILAPSMYALPFEQKRMTLRPHMVTYLSRHGLLVESRHLESQGRATGLDRETYAYASELFGHAVYGGASRLRTIVIPKFNNAICEPQLVLLTAEEGQVAVAPMVLPWIMRWGDAFGVLEKHIAVATEMRKLLQSGEVCVAQLEYGVETDRAVDAVASFVAERAKGG